MRETVKQKSSSHLEGNSIMAHKTATRKATKTVQVISRIEFKSDPRKVVYICRSSNGIDTYQTTLFAGKATSCTCKATCKCYHMTGCETLEAARNPFTATLHIDDCATCGGNHNTNDHAWAMLSMVERQAQIDRVNADERIDPEYEAWKIANGMGLMTRNEYCVVFAIYE
jgi:hypothetical protein